jgi:ATP-dependent RNA helicase RhlE
MSFQKLGLPDDLVAALTKQHLAKPYPIQQKAIPAILAGKDVLGIAKTGSGKTLSYVLPILANLMGQRAVQNRFIDVLVLVPTRELAVQVQEVFYMYSNALTHPIKSMAVYGGVSINPQMKAMRGVQVLVATPGRLLELISANAVHLSLVHTLVLDEADKMLNLGFKEELEQVFTHLKPARQNLLFSATLEPGIDSMHKQVLHHPVVAQVEEEPQDIELIKQVAYSIEKERKGQLLRYLLKTNNMHQVLVFTSSLYQADHVVDKLNKHGIEARAIHSKKSQGARTATLQQFKTGKLRVLVATDLLARGIDISFLPFVINYELPRSPKDYVHRIGRTGRAEQAGEAISFITPDDRHHFKVIQKKMGKWVPLTYAEDIDLSTDTNE